MAGDDTNTTNTATTTTTTTSPGQGEAPAMSPDVSPRGSPASAQDRRASAEWDASKVPPSRFQKRKGSIYSTPSSRDGHVDSNYASKFHALHAEKGYQKAAGK